MTNAGTRRAPRPLSIAALTALALLMVPATAPAQQVSLADFQWLVGEWEGEGPDGTTARIVYAEPEGGVLPSLFRLVRGDRLLLLELITLVEEEDGLFMYVRHFDPALVPLEKEQAIRLRLVEWDDDTFFFENTNQGQNPVRSVVTRTPDGFVSRSYLDRPDGSTDTIEVEYRRR